MRHLSEHTIERYILGEVKASDTIQKINAHLAECQECHRIYNWLRSFYQEFESLPHESSDLLNISRVKPSTLRLTPFESSVNRAYSRPNPLVLAARSKSSYHRYQHLVTLQTEQEEMLVRILFDEKAQRYQLFVVSDSNDHPDSVLIQLPVCSKELLTDKKGRASFTSEKSPRDFQWNHLKGILRFPISQYRITSDIINRLQSQNTFVFDDHTIPMQIDYKKETSKYIFKFLNGTNDLPDSPDLNRMIVNPDSEQHDLYHLSATTAIVDERDLCTTGPFTVSVYK